MHDPPDPSTTPPPPGPAESSINCISCGYNLTGVVIGGACPECGTAVERSLAVHEALPTDGGAIAAMVLGILSIGACGLLGPVAMIIAARAKRDHQAGRSNHGSLIMARVGMITGLIGSILLLAQVTFIVLI